MRAALTVAGAGKDKLAVAHAALAGDFDPDEWDRTMEAVFDDDYYAQEEAEMPNFDENGEEEDDGDWERAAERAIALAAESHNAEERAQGDALARALEAYQEAEYEGGDELCFRYVPVASDTYGLNALDVLLGDDKELNRLVSIKRLAPYAQNPSIRVPHAGSYREDQGRRKKSGQARGKRKRSITTGDDDASTHASDEPKKKRRRRKSESKA